MKDDFHTGHRLEPSVAVSGSPGSTARVLELESVSQEISDEVYAMLAEVLERAGYIGKAKSAAFLNEILEA